MNTTKEMLEHVNLLYKVAYSKTNDSYDADDLVQETYLATLKAVNNGTKIENIKAYLLEVMNNAFYKQLIKKKRRYNIGYSEPMFEQTLQDSDLQKSVDAEAIRRELAYLSKKHREIMVQFYMEGKTVTEIANHLEIPVGTVKSRLDRGREKIKKGIKKMDSYIKNSYQPDTLSLVVAGVTGLNNEPLSVMSNSIEQNLLILAYESPIKISELSKKIGIPMPYIEEIIEKLIYHEFMKKQDGKVWTNFLVLDEEILKKQKESQKYFVNNTFVDLKDTFDTLISDYRNTGILHKFSLPQLYLYGLNYVFMNVYEYLIETLKLLKNVDYPDRPNGGKWIIHFGKKSVSEKMLNSFRLESEFRSDDGKKVTIKVWDTPIGKSPWREDNYTSPEIFGSLLYSTHTGLDIDPAKLILIPELVRLGFLKNNPENKKEVNIPIISTKEMEIINKINKDISNKLIELIGDRLLEHIKNNIIECPKQITPKSPFIHLLSVSEIAMTYFDKIVHDGGAEIEKGKNYPVCVLIVEN